jgi:hypothetical protein
MVVKNCEVRFVAEQAALSPQYFRPERMKSANVRPGAYWEAFSHLASGLIGECDRADFLWRHALFH